MPQTTETQTTESIRFPGATGAPLAARLDRPAGEPRAYALFAHCFTCSKDLRSLVRISRGLADRGLAVLRFDFTGLGESEGDFAATNFSSNLDDLVAAADYLRREHRAPQLLVGHSLGGAAMLAAATRIPEAVAVATIGAPSDPAHLRTGPLADIDPESEETELEIAGRPFRIRRQLLEDLEQQRLLEAVAELRRALLVLHSPVDQVVGIDHARRIYQAAKHPKSFVALDGADHLLLNRSADADYAANILACWAERYLDDGESAAETAAEVGAEVEADADLEPGQVEVVGGASGFVQRIRAGTHLLTADEPLSAGGTDRGPNPYDLLLAALGACTSMTVRMYADRKSWPLDGTRVVLGYSQIHADDCADCESETGKVGVIEKSVRLDGQLEDQQRQRLMEISERCPVHRTLQSELVIRSRAEA